MKDLFFDCLKNFQAYICQTYGRHSFLIGVNYNTHGNSEPLPALTNLKLIFLPPSFTPRLQPMESRILAVLKVHYKRIHMGFAVKAVDLLEKEIYNVGILNAMYFFIRAWNDLLVTLNSNCWRHTKLYREDVSTETDKPKRPLQKGLQNGFEKLEPANSTKHIASFLNSSAENHFMQN